MRILVVGAGAVGGFFGAKLALAGRDVTFLLRGATAERVRDHGLKVFSRFGGDLSLQPRIVTANNLDGPYDVVLLSVKGPALESAIKDFAPAIASDSAILPVLNGMRHMQTLNHRFGQQSVLGGVALCSTELDAEGRIVQLTPAQKIIFGEQDGSLSVRVETLEQQFSGSNFEVAVSTTIEHAMWMKWVQLASLAAMNCLLRGSVGEINGQPHGTETALAVLDEASRVAAANGHPVEDAVGKSVAELLTQSGSPLTASTYRDLMAGAQVEQDEIVGDLLDRGLRKDLALPLLQAAYVSLSIYASRRAAASK